MIYKYYTVMRPVSIGAVPEENMKGFKSYKNRKFDPDACREVWGEVYYTEPLKDWEIEEYELLEGGTVDAESVL